MKKQKNIITSFLKKLLLFCSPFLLFLLLYVYLDPFHVIYTFDSSTNFGFNRDVCSSRFFIKNYPTYKFDSYVFGSSRSMAFTLKDWEPFIHDDRTFHFDASEESIFGVYTKIKYIDEHAGKIKNALIIADSSLFAQTTDDSYMLYCKYYKIAHTSPVNYHLIFFKAFLANSFFIKYIDYQLFHVYRPYMKSVIPVGKRTDNFDSIHNEGSFYGMICAIKADSVNYYSSKKMFYTRPENPLTERPAIGPECLRMLHEIKAIFTKDSTAYKIVISPLYTQKKFSPVDLDVLKDIFGSKNVYDFSGKNSITNFKENYYDKFHFKISIARQILHEIYLGN